MSNRTTEHWDLSLAIVSDLHCHEEKQPQESWLIVAASKKPAGDHPVQALIKLLRDQSVKADVLICPGDLANRVCQKGMIQSWDHLNSLKSELEAKKLLVTLGNHDVDCFKHYSPDPFNIPKTLHDEFPVADLIDQTNFWQRGFYIDSSIDGSEFLILNTVISHNDDKTAKRGTFDHDRIRNLDDELTKRASTATPRSKPLHRIAIMHHHPVLHSQTKSASSDVLEYGDLLLSVLEKHGYKFIIHGHKHEPRVRRQIGPSSEYFIFAAGSFSAILKELSTWTRNLFHIIRLRHDVASKNLIGEILTWEYNKGSGWRPSTTNSAVMPHIARFNSPKQDPPIDRIVAACDSAAGQILKRRDIESAFPSLSFYLPEELSVLQDRLNKSNVKMMIADDGTIDYIGRNA